MNKAVISFVSLMLLAMGSLAAMELAITDPGRGMYVQANPQEYWLITTDGYQSRIYNAELELLETFSLPHADVSIIGAGYDFDSDDNIEVLYSWYDITNYQTHVFLRDITTGQNDFSYTSNSYYAFTLYSASERKVIVNKYNGTDYQQCYIYTSGVVHTSAPANTLPLDVIHGSNTYPNPFSYRMALNFTLSEDKPVSIAVYNIKGQKLRTFQDNYNLRAGDHVIYWDGSNDTGSRLPSGEYLFLVSSGNQTEVNKVIFIK
jgi:FlgD Ig-like domain